MAFIVKYKDPVKKFNAEATDVEIRKQFKITKSVFLQYFDNEFNEYLDCEWDDIRNKSYKSFKICDESLEFTIENEQNDQTKKIKCQEGGNETNVVYEELLPTLERSISEASTVILPHKTSSLQNLSSYTNSDVEDKEKDFADSQKQIDNDPAHIGINDLNMQIANNGEQMEIKIQTNSASNYERKNQLLTIYKLPYIAGESDLGKALNNKKPLTRSLKSQFLSKIYKSFAKENKTYIRHQYSDIAYAIINEYPHLANGCLVEVAKNTWKKILYTKFAHSRSREDKDKEEVILRKERRLNKSTNETAENWYDVPNYKPSFLNEGEDDITIESHKLWMKEEIKKENWNINSINKRMDLTFNNRRSLLFKEPIISSENILLHYPCLGIETQAICEIRRLFQCRFVC